MNIRGSVIILVTVIFTLILTGCTQSESKSKQSAVKYYHFQAEIFSTVNQKNKLQDGIRMQYTVSLKDFHPKGEEFDRYNDQSSAPGTNGFIVLNENTRVYMKNGETKVTLDPTILKAGDKIDFWVYVYNYSSGTHLVADEINLLN